MKRRKVAKGQASFEYILTAAVIGIMILPAAYLFFRYSQSSGDQIDKAQLDKLGRDIISNAERVYYQGGPSRIELEARMPKGVQNISIIGDWGSGAQMLIISAATEGIITDFPYPSSVNINGSFNYSLYEISIGPGIKKVSIEAYEVPGVGGSPTTSFTFINLGGRCPRSVTYDFNMDGAVDTTDQTFLTDCQTNTPGKPKYRPEKTWQDGWFNNIGAMGGSKYAVCMNADYNSDCIIDNTDLTMFRSKCPVC